MDASIVAAVLSAIAAAVLAGPGRRLGRRGRGVGVRMAPRRNGWLWLLGTGGFGCWLLYAGIAHGWYLAGPFALASPAVVLLLLAWLMPVRFPTGAAYALALCPFVFLMDPLRRLRQGIPFDGGFEADRLALQLGAAATLAAVAGGVAHWRLRCRDQRDRPSGEAARPRVSDRPWGFARSPGKTIPRTSRASTAPRGDAGGEGYPQDVDVAPGTLAREIAELAKLHRAGILSDEEFARSKEKLISGG